MTLRTETDDVPSLHRRAWLRGLIGGTAGLAMMTLFGGSSCHYDDDDWDDDDDDDDDDDFGPSTIAEGIPSYRLEDFELVPAAVVGAHPVARLEQIRGLSLSAWAGSQELGERDFAEFAAKVLQHNDALIGLPRSAGRLVLVGVQFEADATLVRYAQIRGDGGEARPMPGAELTFRFDLIGNLLAIENTTVM